MRQKMSHRQYFLILGERADVSAYCPFKYADIWETQQLTLIPVACLLSLPEASTVRHRTNFFQVALKFARLAFNISDLAVNGVVLLDEFLEYGDNTAGWGFFGVWHLVKKFVGESDDSSTPIIY